MSMTRSEVYGEGKQHDSSHMVDLGRLHKAMCEVLKNEKGRKDVVCGPGVSASGTGKGVKSEL